MEHFSELPPPHTIHEASRTMELARVWIVDGDQHVAISGNLWDDPAAWGLMLVDLAKHVANAYAERGMNREDALARILAGFQVEMKHPTDDPSPVE